MIKCLPYSRSSTLPHSHLAPWNWYCGIRRSLIPTQPNPRSLQNYTRTYWSMQASWFRERRYSKTSGRASGLYRWFTISKMETHNHCGQSQGWDKIQEICGSPVLNLSSIYCSIFNKTFTIGCLYFSSRPKLPVCVWWKEFLNSSWRQLLPKSRPTALDWGLFSKLKQNVHVCIRVYIYTGILQDKDHFTQNVINVSNRKRARLKPQGYLRLISTMSYFFAIIQHSIHHHSTR